VQPARLLSRDDRRDLSVPDAPHRNDLSGVRNSVRYVSATNKPFFNSSSIGATGDTGQRPEKRKKKKRHSGADDHSLSNHSGAIIDLRLSVRRGRNINVAQHSPPPELDRISNPLVKPPFARQHVAAPASRNGSCRSSVDGFERSAFFLLLSRRPVGSSANARFLASRFTFWRLHRSLKKIATVFGRLSILAACMLKCLEQVSDELLAYPHSALAAMTLEVPRQLASSSLPAPHVSARFRNALTAFSRPL